MSSSSRQLSARKVVQLPEPMGNCPGNCTPQPGGRPKTRVVHNPRMDPAKMKGFNPDYVKSYLLGNPQVLEECVLENVSVDQLCVWIEKKKRGKQTWAGSSKVPCVPNRFSFTKMDVVEKQLLDELSNKPDYLPLLYEFIVVIAGALNVDGYALFAVRPGVQEINLYIHSEDGNYQLQPVGKANTKTSVVAYVAHELETVLVKNLAQEAARFPKGVGSFTTTAQSCLTLPLTMPSGDVLCLMEFTRGVSKPPFCELELQTATAISSLLGNVAYQCQMNKSLRVQADLNDFLLEVSRVMFDDMIVIDTLVEKIMLFTKDLVQADRCAFFLVDEKNNELYSDILDEGQIGDDGKSVFKKSDKEIRFSKEKGIAGHVAQTGEIISIPDAYSDERFNKEVDKATGYTTRNIMCMPIISKGKVIGVVQVINKKNDVLGFTKADEASFRMFAVYCAMALHYSKMYSEVKLQSAQFSVAQEQICYHAVCSEDEYKQLRCKPLLDKLPDDIDSFDFYGPTSSYSNNLHNLFIHMVIDICGPKSFDMDKMCRMVQSVKKNYRPVAYHNWKHGFNVAHCMYCILKRLKPHGLMSDLRMKAVLVASLCHDVDHRGYNNAFFKKFDEPLAQVYTTSVMEQHHFATTVTLLQQVGHNIFDDLSSEDYKKMLNYVKHAIINTDLALFFGNQKNLAKMVVAGTINVNDETCFNNLIALMMTAADLSAVCKPWAVQEDTVQYIYEEFYFQGDAEKQLGADPMPMMDRNNKDNLAKDQVGFIKFVCLPGYQTLADVFPETTPLLNGCTFNLEQWQRVVEGKSTELWEPGKSEVKK